MSDLTERMKSVISLVAQELEDEGDRIYLGSTNHADALRDLDQDIFESGFDRAAQTQVGETRQAHLRTISDALAASQAEVARLRSALKPFADFADPSGRVPPALPITHGSAMAKRQLRMVDCYEAARALAASQPQGGE
jgi:hypothetical protein